MSVCCNNLHCTLSCSGRKSLDGKNYNTDSSIFNFFFFFALIDLWHFYFMPVNCEEIPKNLSVCSCVLPKIYLRFQKTYQISSKIKKQNKTPKLPPKNHSISNKHMKVNASIKPKCFTVKIWWATAFHSLLFPRRPAAGFSFV